MLGESFDKCTACSKKIVDSFAENKSEFVLRTCNQPDYLEDLTGIKEMLSKINIDDIELFDDFEMEEALAGDDF